MMLEQFGLRHRLADETPRSRIATAACANDPVESYEADHSIRSGDREMYGQIAETPGGVGPEREIEIRGVLLVQPAQQEQLAVGPFDDARNVFFENTRQVARLPHPVFVGAGVLLVLQQEYPAPDGDDHDHTQIGRGLPECAEPLQHAVGSDPERQLGDANAIYAQGAYRLITR